MVNGECRRWQYWWLSNICRHQSCQPNAALGTWGIDIDGNGTDGKGKVWAVLNHNSEFAVIPEPGTLVAGGFGMLGIAVAGLRRRRLVM